ncbi:MAG TPA: hypothetical protein VM659_24730 [Dongiaceae bacterium]|nr:hypothetical protein [Dongiaceae bacterium]
MGSKDHTNEALYEAIRSLIADNELDEDSDAYRISMQVVHQGFDSLSERQQHIYERVKALLETHHQVGTYR